MGRGAVKERQARCTSSFPENFCGAARLDRANKRVAAIRAGSSLMWINASAQLS
jgi:hypothetical protein